MASTVTGVLLTGIHSARPSSGVTAGTLYSCTTHSLVYQTSDTGSTWATWATLGTGSGSGTLTTVKDEGTNLSTAVVSVNFVGLGVTATGTTAATITIPGAGYEFDYAQVTSAAAPTATTEATANAVVTGNAVTYDGSTTIMLQFFCPQARPVGTANAWFSVVLYDGSSSIGQLGDYFITANTNFSYAPLSLFRRLTPSAAAHTYSARVYVSGGTADLQAGAGAASGDKGPMFLRQTKV